MVLQDSHILTTHIDWFSSCCSGSMEFVVPAADPNSFFPIDVKFTSNKTFCDLKVCVLMLDFFDVRVEGLVGHI